MKAVNLIPAELRRGDSGGGHSGGLVYIVLAALCVLVVMTAVWAGLGKVTSDRKAEATRIENEAAQIEARAAALAHYEAAAAAAKGRVDEVRELATNRFEWAHTLREISRTLPKEAWLSSMTGTVAPNVNVEGGVGNPMRAGDAGPALEIVGCTRKQDSVARLMAQLRSMDGVTRVALSSSEKRDGGGASAGGSGTISAGDCGVGVDRPQFNLVVFFRGKGQPAAAGANGTSSAAPATAAPATPAAPADKSSTTTPSGGAQ